METKHPDAVLNLSPTDHFPPWKVNKWKIYIFWSYILPGGSVVVTGMVPGRLWGICCSRCDLSPAFPWSPSFHSWRWCLEALSSFCPGCLSYGLARFAIVTFGACDFEAVCVNEVETEFLNSAGLSSCKMKLLAWAFFIAFQKAGLVRP